MREETKKVVKFNNNIINNHSIKVIYLQKVLVPHIVIIFMLT